MTTADKLGRAEKMVASLRTERDDLISEKRALLERLREGNLALAAALTTAREATAAALEAAPNSALSPDLRLATLPLARPRTADKDLASLHVSLARALRNLRKIHDTEFDAAFNAAAEAQNAAIQADTAGLRTSLERFKALAEPGPGRGFTAADPHGPGGA